MKHKCSMPIRLWFAIVWPFHMNCPVANTLKLPGHCEPLLSTMLRGWRLNCVNFITGLPYVLSQREIQFNCNSNWSCTINQTGNWYRPILDISTVSVIGIWILLLTDYTSMMSYILNTWYLQVKMEVKREITGSASDRQVLTYAQRSNEKFRHRGKQLWQKLQHLSVSLLFKKAEIECAFRHLCCTHAAYSMMI